MILTNWEQYTTRQSSRKIRKVEKAVLHKITSGESCQSEFTLKKSVEE